MTAAASKNKGALTFGKRELHKTKQMEFNEKIDYLSDSLFKLIQTPEARSAIKSFMEKKSPSSSTHK